MDVPVPQVDAQDLLVPPIMEEIACVVQCTPHDVASGETDLEAREEIVGRVVSVWKELRQWEYL